MNILTTIGTIAIMVVIIFALKHLYLKMFSEKSEPESKLDSKSKKKSPLVSLIYMLKSPRNISENDLAKYAKKAFNENFEIGNANAANTVMKIKMPTNASPNATDFMLKVNNNVFLVIYRNETYIDYSKEVEKKVIDKRLSNAIKKHTAWISVDAFGEVDESVKDETYHYIGKIIAELADKDCLVIHCPEYSLYTTYDTKILKTLRSDKPLSIFEQPAKEPVIDISENNPEMKKAVAEAKKRWPEFVEVFKNSDKEKSPPFIVKAKFEDGDKKEFMWIQVSEVDDKEIHGTLENEPNELTNVKKGQYVSVPVSNLNDWAYIIDGKSIGGFTMKIIQDKAEGN